MDLIKNKSSFPPNFNIKNKFGEGFHYLCVLETAEYFGRIFKLFWGSVRGWNLSVIKIYVSGSIVYFTGDLHLEVILSDLACMHLVDTREFFICIYSLVLRHHSLLFISKVTLNNLSQATQELDSSPRDPVRHVFNAAKLIHCEVIWFY